MVKKGSGKTSAEQRAERLKAALRQNMKRRKTQMQARQVKVVHDKGPKEGHEESS
ncbi:MAG: hypothetical protein AAF943_08805 [Pseudomonadota bacterium]